MPGESDRELAQIIETDIVGSRILEDREEALFKHSADLADRWIAFAKMETISLGARVSNDLFRALIVCLRMTLESVPESHPARQDLESLVAQATNLSRSLTASDVHSLVDSLRRTFSIGD